jgi:hypothetical protein
MKQVIIILNFCIGKIIIANFPEELENASEWFESDANENEEYGLKFRESDCQYMVVSAEGFEIEYLLPESYISTIIELKT